MSGKHILVATAGVVVGAVVFNFTPALAEYPTFDAITHSLLTAAQDAITKAVDKVQTSVTDIGTQLDDKLTAGFTQMANYDKATVGAQEEIANASNQANATFQKSIRNAQIRDDHTTSPQACAALNYGQTVTVAQGQAWRVAQAIGNVTDRRGQALPGTPAYAGQGQAAAAITQLHLSRYCNENEAAAGLCAANPTRQNLDQSATSLIGVSAYNPDPNNSGVDAANDFATNVLQPVVPAASRGDALTSVVGQDAEARRRGYNARMSLARAVANDVIASRSNSVNLTEAEKAQQTNEGVTPTDQSSWLGALELDVNRRSSGVDWAASLQAMPPKSVMVEIATELAMGNYIALENYKQGQQIAMLVAAQLAATAEADLKPAASMPVPKLVSQ